MVLAAGATRRSCGEVARRDHPQAGVVARPGSESVEGSKAIERMYEPRLSYGPSRDMRHRCP